MILDKFNKIIRETSLDERENIKFSMKVQERIHELLDEKFQGKQSLLANKMQVSEAAVSKLLSGIQNYQIKTLMKLQIAFDAPIIAVCSHPTENTTYVYSKMTHGLCHESITVSATGMEESSVGYGSFKKIKNLKIKMSIITND